MAIPYDRTGTLPTGGPSKGTTALRDLICDEFEWCPRLPFYNARDVCNNHVEMDGSGRVCNLSPHAEGRAFDAMTTKRSQGDPLVEWCVANHEALHIQEVIFFRQRWASNTLKFAEFKGTNPHTDHVHIAQTRFGAAHPELVDEFRGLLIREPNRVIPKTGVGRNEVGETPGNEEGGTPVAAPLTLLAEGMAAAGAFISTNPFTIGMGQATAPQPERDAFIWIRHFINVKLNILDTGLELTDDFYGQPSADAITTFQTNIRSLIDPAPFDVTGVCGPETWFWLTFPGEG